MDWDSPAVMVLAFLFWILCLVVGVSLFTPTCYDDPFEEEDDWLDGLSEDDDENQEY